MNNILRVALIADGAALLLFWLLHNRLIERFSRNPIDFSALTDALLFVLFYALFLGGVLIVRKVRGAVPAVLQSRRTLALIGVPFAVVMLLIIGDLTAFFDTIFDIDFGDTGNGYYFLVTPAIYILVALLYFLLLIQPVENSAQPLRGQGAALLAIDMFGGVLSAYFAAVLPMLLPAASPVVVFVVVAVLLLFMVLFPRVLFALKAGRSLSVVPYVAMLSLMLIIAIF